LSPKQNENLTKKRNIEFLRNMRRVVLASLESVRQSKARRPADRSAICGSGLMD